jgi:UDP-glucose 4-epimerase
MKILVTGGCGFIGSHLVDRLVELNHEVFVIDLYKKNLNNKAHYIIADINDLEKTKKAYENTSCIFHLAAEVQIQNSIEDPLKTFQTNIMGLQTVFENMKRYKVPKIIFSSSSAVYAETDNKIEESYALAPLNPYALSKKIGEDLCLMHKSLYDIDIVILRYFNVYGPRQNNNSPYSGVISLFMKQIENNAPLTITGDGEQTRDFVHVSDVVEANIASMLYQNTNKHYIFNIATGESVSILDIAQKISNNIEFIPPRKGEIKHSSANIKKATE